MREIEWTEAALEDMAAIDKGVALRVKQAVERFAGTGGGNVKRLRGANPPEYRLRVGDYRVRFHLGGSAIRIMRVRNRREAYRRVRALAAERFKTAIIRLPCRSATSAAGR